MCGLYLSVMRPNQEETDAMSDLPQQIVEAWDAVAQVQHHHFIDADERLEQARLLLSDAVVTLYDGFRGMVGEIDGQMEALQVGLHEDGEGIHDAVTQAQGVLRDLTSAMDALRERSELAAGRVSRMTDRIGAIFDLVRQVDQLSEDTSMLAINAALEAARAGPAGKGFGVVASEIRALSRNTKNLNAMIEESVLGAREDVEFVSDAIQKVVNEDCARALEAQQGAGVAVAQLQAAQMAIHDTMETVNASSRRVKEQADAAVRALQFEDMVGQLLTAVGKRIAAARDASAQRPTSTEDLEALQEALRRCLEDAAGAETEQALRNVVSQEDVEAGDVELF